MKSNMCIKQDVLNVLNTFPLHYVSHSGCVCVVVESVHHGHGSERHLQRDTSWSFGVQHEIFIFTQVFEKSLCSQQCLTQVKGQWDWLRLSLDSVRFLVVCLTQKREKTTLSPALLSVLLRLALLHRFTTGAAWALILYSLWMVDWSPKTKDSQIKHASYFFYLHMLIRCFINGMWVCSLHDG